MNKIALLVIRLYQLTLSPYIGRQCRFDPTCSAYAMECYKNLGFFRATYYMVKRISRCHPFSEGGQDLPPKE
jgi:putative membrane protein insertion efficiency factor